MRKLGLVGGVSPESTEIYYRLLNQAARDRLGPRHSANIILYTLDFGVMMDIYEKQDWDAYAGEIVKAAKHLEAGGADALMICSNTSNLAADAVMKATDLPFIHVLDALADAMSNAKVKKPLLLGTSAVMGQGYYQPALRARYDGAVKPPDDDGQTLVGKIIFDELVNGNVFDRSRKALIEMIKRHDCDSVILGCTELCMILSQQDLDLPVFDTTALHAAAASAFAYGEG